MITRVLCIIASIAICLMGYTAYLDRSLEVIEVAKIPLTIKAVPVPNQQPIARTTEFKKAPSLHWRGGIKISSPHKRFGGLSGLEVSADGRSLLAIGDKGLWFTGRLNYDLNGNLLSLTNGLLSTMRGTQGQNLIRKKDRDSESIALADNGAIYVSFERDHRILEYSAPLATTTGSIRLPREFTDIASNNRGIEALTWLTGDCLLAIPERTTTATSKQGSVIEAYLWHQQSWDKLYLEPNNNFLPTGLSSTPEGDLLLLEREFSFLEGFKTSLRFFPASEIQTALSMPDYVMRGDVLATFEGAQSIDNMEGISSRIGAKGEILIYLLSDDNLSFAQDTLLLMFELQKQRKPAGKSTAGCSKNKTAYSAALETKAF
ncbi:esterase-like activity of phytase family protein [Kiloniella sp. EL199]|uniref:esterase-like activity of phytase family protein n=1 Tax=Kiloniella sp. EL199 TaxID=2107581 RepID=UPI000EA2A58C|nr:esterase-like activity of phytase family protein [Kiloniella sp. EL199]